MPRTDKNGRVTTRHMKTMSASTSTPSIPPIQPPTANTDKSIDEHDTELFAAVYGDEASPALPRNHEKAIRFMNERHPELIDTVNTLLAKENHGGSQSVRKYLMTSFHLLGDQMSVSDDTDALELSYKDGVAVELEETLVRAWAVGSVRSEFTGTRYHDYYDNDFLDGLAGLQLVIYDHDTLERGTGTDYWRGMTALYIAGPNSFFDTEEEQREARQFVEWASKHTDINLAIHTAIERSTLNVGTLEGVLTQDAPAPAMSRGIL